MNFDYLSGLIDGEGNIGLYIANNSFSSNFVITNTNLDLLKQIQTFVGGTISKHIKHDKWKQAYCLYLPQNYVRRVINERYKIFVQASS